MKKFLLLALSLLLVVCSTACASGKSYSSEIAWDSEAPNMMGSDHAESEDIYLEDSKTDGGFANNSVSDTNASSAPNDLANRKLIKRVSMEIQTEEYDAFLITVKTLISSSGAYIQNSTMYDRSSKYSNRSATLTVRVPADRLSEFTDGIYAGATVTYYNEDLDDVTAQYKDVESRIESLKIELEALNKLLAEAVDLQYVISLHDRITDIRYELDRYESSIRNYDELIAYSTVTLHISEVKRVAIVEEQTTWEEIKNNLSQNMSDIGEFFRQLFIGLASSLPYIVILVAVFGTVTVVIVVSVKKHRKKKINKDNTDK